MNNDKTFLIERGTVVAIEAGYAFVESERSSGCSGCKTSSCGSSALASLFSQSAKPIQVKNNVGCKIGDRVELIMDESRLLKHSFMAYGLPLIGLFLGAWLLSNMGGRLTELTVWQVDLLAGVGAAVGLFVGWWITRRFYKPVLPEIKKVL